MTDYAQARAAGRPIYVKSRQVGAELGISSYSVGRLLATLERLGESSGLRVSKTSVHLWRLELVRPEGGERWLREEA